MPPGAEPAGAPEESSAQSAQAQTRTTAAAAAQKMAQQEAEDAAETEANAVAADKVPRKPYPAYKVPLAGKGLMLDVARAGDHLVAVGAHGDIVTSTDGIHWTQSQSPVRELLTAVTFVDADNGWAVGHDSVIIHSADGGKTWALQSFQPQLQSPLLNVSFLDPQHGFAVGAFGQLRGTTDGGARWHDVDADNIRSAGLNFYDMIKLGDGSLLIVGEQGTLNLSTDQGATWQKLDSPYQGSFFGALPSGPKGALVYGLRGNAYITDDVGTGLWKQVPTHVTTSFFGGSRLKDGSFVLVGAHGAIMQISADGNTVKSLTGPSDQYLDAVLPQGSGLVLAGLSGMQLQKSMH